jgi:hypothetical protein
MKFLYLLSLLIFTGQAVAFSGNSLTWQKLALEEKVQRKFNSSLSGILKDNQYLVEVEVEVAEPGAPNFGESGHKNGPRVSDVNTADSRGDYIAFSKMGLEVPVVEKFLDEDRTKLMNLYRYNESYDLFKNLTGLKVTVYLSDKIPQNLLDIVKNVIANSKLAVSGIKPNVKFESITMEWVNPEEKKKPEELKNPEAPKKQEEPKIWTKDWYEWASRWGNAFGMIIGAIIIGLIGLSLFKQWKEFMEKFAKDAAARAENNNEDEEEKKSETTSTPDPALAQEDQVSLTKGYERFQQFLEQHPEDAINMVRNWLNEGDEIYLTTLRGLAQQASPVEMEKLMAGLTEHQRNQWKGLLGKHLEVPEVVAANKFIFQEVLKAFLVPSKIKDGELLNLIMELTPKSTCAFMKEFEHQVGVLLNVLNPTVVTKILAEVDNETTDHWLTLGGEFNENDMYAKEPELKAALRKFKAENGPSPFAQRIITMIPTAGINREGSLYKALFKASGRQTVLEVARKHFPSELVMELPSPFLKEIIQSYPMHKRIEFLQSRSEAARKELLDMVAEKGTPSRDLLDMELENIARDEGRRILIQAKSDEIWQDFVQLTRTNLTKRGSYAHVIDPLLETWAQKLNHLQGIKGGLAA